MRVVKVLISRATLLGDDGAVAGSLRVEVDAEEPISADEVLGILERAKWAVGHGEHEHREIVLAGRGAP